MPRGIPNTPKKDPSSNRAEGPPIPDPEVEKLKKELEEARAKLAQQATVEEKVAPPPTQEPVVPKTISKRIPVHSLPGKAIEVSEHGYDFQNIHIRRDIPVDVLAEAFIARVGDSQKGQDIAEAFFQPKSMIALYASSQKKRRVRVVNGVVEYGAEKFVIPFIAPEVILRVLEDRWRNDLQARSFFAGIKEVEYAKSLAGINKVYPLLA